MKYFGKMIVGLAAALSFSSVFAMNAGLTLINSTHSPFVFVSCNGIPGLPVAASALNMTFETIHNTFNSNNVNCKFSLLGGQEIGTANLIINGASAQIVSATTQNGYQAAIQDDAGDSITLANNASLPAPTNSAASIEVTLKNA